MTRIPSPAEDLLKFVGKTITKEVLFGRGYCLVQDGDVVEDNFPRLKDFGFDDSEENDAILYEEEDGTDSEICEDDDEEEEITCRKVKRYIAGELENFIYDDSQYWIKGLPAQPEDVDNQEVYMVVCIGTNPIESGLEITNVMILARMVEQIGGGWFSIPGAATMQSHFFEMELVPPELVHEVESLIAGRYITRGFTLIGKPMPENKDVFHPNPPYSLAKNSGWRNIYWHISIDVDDDDVIQDVELSTYERETSMFQRPYSMSDDPADAFDGALTIVDQYTEEEWNKIMK